MLRVYRVVSKNNPTSPADWEMFVNKKDLNGAIFVTRSVDQALAWALQFSHNLDDWRDEIEELEVNCIRDLDLKPIQRWMKVEPMSFASNSEFPFKHPRFERVRAKWWRFKNNSSYGDWVENNIEFEEEERDTPYLVEGVILPCDVR